MGSSPVATHLPKRNPRKTKRAPFERRVMRLSLLLVVPGLLFSSILIWLETWAPETKLILIAVELIACLIITTSLREDVVRHLQTLTNVNGALNEEDYSFR